MKTIKKIITLILILSLINSNVYCATYTAVNNGPDPITVNIDLIENSFVGRVPEGTTPVATISKRIPGGSTNNDFDAGKDMKAFAIYLTKLGKRLPLSNSNVKTGDKRDVFMGGRENMTFIFNKNKDGVWGVSYHPSTK